MDANTKNYIDSEIKRVIMLGTKKYGDTPTDANQLTPKRYVSSVVSSAISAAASSFVGVPAGANGEIQFNKNGSFGASSVFSFDVSSSILSLSGGTSFFMTGTGGVVVGTGIVSHVGNAVFNETQFTVNTTDATPTNVTLGSIPTNTLGYLFEIYVRAFFTSGSGGSTESAGYIRRGLYKNVAGTVTLIGAVQDGFTAEADAAWDCTLAISGTNIVAQVTGDASSNLTWAITSRIYH